MKFRHFLSFILFSGLLFFSFSTTTAGKTRLTATRVGGQYQGEYLKSVMVVAMVNKMENRKIVEDVFAKKFQSYGIKSISSGEIIPDGDKLEKDFIKAEAERLGYEFLLVTHLIKIDKKTEQISIPMTGSGVLVGGIYLPGDRYDMPTMGMKQTRVKLDNRLYEVETEKLIWSSASESIDPKSAKEIAEQLIGLVMKSLRQNKLIK